MEGEISQRRGAEVIKDNKFQFILYRRAIYFLLLACLPRKTDTFLYSFASTTYGLLALKNIQFAVVHGFLAIALCSIDFQLP